MALDATRLHDLAISDSGFVFDPLTGFTFTVNPTGLLLLQGLKQGKSLEELQALIHEGFELDGHEDIGLDVSDFVATLKSAGLVR
jgi:PqqD family protein of HPr-rel-A system